MGSVFGRAASCFRTSAKDNLDALACTHHILHRISTVSKVRVLTKSQLCWQMECCLKADAVRSFQDASCVSVPICLSHTCRMCVCVADNGLVVTPGAYLPNQHVDDLHCNTAGLEDCRKPWGICGCRPAHPQHVLARQNVTCVTTHHRMEQCTTQDASIHDKGRISRRQGCTTECAIHTTQ